MSKGRIFFGFFKVVGTLGVLSFCAHLFITEAAGRITKSVFEEGSGCSVELHNPTVRYFPLRASIENIHVFSSEEGASRGFRAERLIVQLEFSALLRKQVVLNHLSITGARIESEGEETAFIRVLEFLFKKRTKDLKRYWHSPLTANWGVWVQTVDIRTVADAATTQLSIGTEDVMAHGRTAIFTATDSSPMPGAPVRMTLDGSELELSIKDSPSLPLGFFQAVGDMQRGVLTVHDAKVSSDAFASANTPSSPRRSLSTGVGTLFFGDEERYSFSIRGDVFDSYAAKLVFPIADMVAPTNPSASYTMEINGPLNKPEFNGAVSVSFGRGAPLFIRDSCAVHNAKAEYRISVDAFTLEKIELEEVLQDGRLSVLFNDELPLSIDATIELDPRSGYIARCLPVGEVADGNAEMLEPFSRAVHEALANSKTKLSLAGSIAQKQFRGVLDSEMYTTSTFAHSLLRAEVELKDDSVSLQLRERGVAPKIGRQLRTDELAQETRFEIGERAAVNLAATLSLKELLLTVSSFEMKRYPANKLVARLAPFISESLYQRIGSTLAAESEVDASITGALQLQSFVQATKASQPVASQRASGKVSFSKLILDPFAIDSLTIPFVIEGNNLSTKSLMLRTPGGSITADGSLALADLGLNVSLSSEKLKPAAFTSVRSVLEQLNSEVEFTGSVTGNPSAPTLSLALFASSDLGESQGYAADTRVTVESDSKEFRIHGQLLGERGKVAISYPRVSGADARLQLDLNSFPLPKLRDDDGELDGNSMISASLRYDGPTANLLLGRGQIAITDLRWREGQLRVERDKPLSASIRDGALYFEDVELSLRDRALRVTGNVHHQKGWNAAILGTWELGTIGEMIHPLEQVSGALSIDVEVRGPTLEPDLSGTVELNDGSVSVVLANSVVGLNSAKGLVRFNRDSATIERFDALVGEGRIRIEGGVTQLLDPVDRVLSLRAAIDDGRLEPVANLNVQFDSLLALQKQGENPFTLTGDITIAEARYEQRLQIAEMLQFLTQMILGSDAQSTKGARPKELPLSVDVMLRAPTGLVLETDIANGELRGDVRIIGRYPHLGYEGTIEVASGVFQFGPNQFEVISGEIIFSPRGGVTLDPKLAIVSETIVKTASREEHTVRLSITGTLSQPEVRFTSDSGLSENEIVALFGLGGRGLELLTTREDRSFREILDPRSNLSLRERLVGLTGFRDVQIESGLSEDTGEFVPRVRARRPLVGESQLEVASELSGEQVSEAEIQYPLTHWLDLTAGWRSRPVTEDVTTSSGSYSVGVRAQQNFLGTGIIVPLFSQSSSNEER